MMVHYIRSILHGLPNWLQKVHHRQWTSIDRARASMIISQMRRHDASVAMK